MALDVKSIVWQKTWKQTLIGKMGLSLTVHWTAMQHTLEPEVLHPEYGCAGRIEIAKFYGERFPPASLHFSASAMHGTSNGIFKLNYYSKQVEFVTFAHRVEFWTGIVQMSSKWAQTLYISCSIYSYDTITCNGMQTDIELQTVWWLHIQIMFTKYNSRNWFWHVWGWCTCNFFWKKLSQYPHRSCFLHKTQILNH